MLKREFSITKKSARISFEECQMLQLLLERGMSFKECLDVFESSREGALFAELKNNLSQGESVQESMEQILDKKIVHTFRFFTQFLSIEKSLKCSLSLISLETSVKNEMIKKCIYPVLMLILAIGLSLVFNYVLFPVMMDLLESFNTETEYLVWIGSLLKMSAIILILFGFLFAAAAVFCLQKSRIASVYQFICDHFKSPFLRKVFSYYFTRYFLELLSVGCSTQQSIQMMKNAKDQPIISLYSYRINELLLMGKSIKDAFSLNGFDPALAQFAAIGMMSSKMEEMLKNYCVSVKKECEKKIKKITLAIQCMTYGMIGIILIFIYQLLLSPMNIITQI